MGKPWGNSRWSSPEKRQVLGHGWRVGSGYTDCPFSPPCPGGIINHFITILSCSNEVTGHVTEYVFLAVHKHFPQLPFLTTVLRTLRFSNVATHWLYQGSFEKHWSLGPIPDQLNQKRRGRDSARHGYFKKISPDYNIHYPEVPIHTHNSQRLGDTSWGWSFISW